MKTLLAFILALIALFAVVPAAQAHVRPSQAYCAYSLKGGGTLAGDNEIWRAWKALEAAGYNVTSAAPFSATRHGDHRVNYWWKMNTTRGPIYSRFTCYVTFPHTGAEGYVDTQV